jgi:hypothetical protein
MSLMMSAPASSTPASPRACRYRRRPAPAGARPRAPPAARAPALRPAAPRAAGAVDSPPMSRISAPFQQLLCMRHGRTGTGMPPAVRKGIRRHIDDAHDRGRRRSMSKREVCQHVFIARPGLKTAGHRVPLFVPEAPGSHRRRRRIGSQGFRRRAAAPDEGVARRPVLGGRGSLPAMMSSSCSASMVSQSSMALAMACILSLLSSISLRASGTARR